MSLSVNIRRYLVMVGGNEDVENSRHLRIHVLPDPKRFSKLNWSLHL